MPYSDTFKNHLARPRNVGELSNASVVAEETNPVCGDRIRLYLIVEGGLIQAAKYLAYGCPPTLVCGSVLTEMIIRESKEKVAEITRSELIERVGGLPSRKHHAAALAIETLHSALAKLPLAVE